MSVGCLISVAILCLQVPAVNTVSVSVNMFGIGGAAHIQGPGWEAHYQIFRDVIVNFNRTGASQACAGTDCIYYRRDCKKNGSATECVYDVDAGHDTVISVKADNDAALKFAMDNIALNFRVTDNQSRFPLSLLDGSTPATNPQTPATSPRGPVQ